MFLKILHKLIQQCRYYKKLAKCISTLLQVEEPHPDDSYSKNVCEKCKGKVESLEKAVKQLHSFREMAKNALMNA